MVVTKYFICCVGVANSSNQLFLEIGCLEQHGSKTTAFLLSQMSPVFASEPARKEARGGQGTKHF